MLYVNALVYTVYCISIKMIIDSLNPQGVGGIFLYYPCTFLDKNDFGGLLVIFIFFIQIQYVLL